MKITIEPSEEQGKYPVDQRHAAVSLEIEGDDLTIDEVGELMRGALVAWGYSPFSVSALFKEDVWS